VSKFCKNQPTGGSKRVRTMDIDQSDSPDMKPTSTKDFEQFYRAHYDVVSNYVARRLSPSAHDEVVAATFVVAWRKFDKVSTPSLPWLYRIAAFEVAHERRRAARSSQVAAVSDLNLTESYPFENVIDISAAFSQLSDSDAELLRLLYWEQLSRLDAAQVLGCSVNTLNVRYHRALDRLASSLHRLSNLASDLDASSQLPKENQ
jgi:RNA polymerase sigma factor (sigma-70 family)